MLSLRVLVVYKRENAQSDWKPWLIRRFPTVELRIVNPSPPFLPRDDMELSAQLLPLAKSSLSSLHHTDFLAFALPAQDSFYVSSLVHSLLLELLPLLHACIAVSDGKILFCRALHKILPFGTPLLTSYLPPAQLLAPSVAGSIASTTVVNNSATDIFILPPPPPPWFPPSSLSSLSSAAGGSSNPSLLSRLSRATSSSNVSTIVLRVESEYNCIQHHKIEGLQVVHRVHCTSAFLSSAKEIALELDHHHHQNEGDFRVLALHECVVQHGTPPRNSKTKSRIIRFIPPKTATVDLITWRELPNHETIQKLVPSVTFRLRKTMDSFTFLLRLEPFGEARQQRITFDIHLPGPIENVLEGLTSYPQAGQKDLVLQEGNGILVWTTTTCHNNNRDDPALLQGVVKRLHNTKANEENDDETCFVRVRFDIATKESDLRVSPQGVPIGWAVDVEDRRSFGGDFTVWNPFGDLPKSRLMRG